MHYCAVRQVYKVGLYWSYLLETRLQLMLKRPKLCPNQSTLKPAYYNFITLNIRTKIAYKVCKYLS